MLRSSGFGSSACRRENASSRAVSVAARCAPCHSATPTQPGFAEAPKGLVLDTPQDILTHVAVIAPQVAARAMPIGNLTGMTDPERTQLLDWIQRGAPH